MMAGDDRVGALERRIRRLEAVVEASALLNSTLDLERLVGHIISIAVRLIGAERGSLFLLDAEAGVLRSLVAQGLDGRPLELAVGDGIVGSVAAAGEPIILDDPYGDPRFDPTVDRATGFCTRSLLTVPVRDRDRNLVAVLQLLNRTAGGFGPDDVGFLAELETAFAVALATARLHADLMDKQRQDEELRLAAEIQRALQPRDGARLPGLELETLVRPCREVGGDYWDLIPRAGGDRWWIVLADISGKGVSAGLIAANVQSYLWSRRDDRRSLAAVVADGNQLLHRLTDGLKYATLVIAEWRPASGWLAWVSAGHPPMLLRRGRRITELGASGPPMGLMPDQRYRVRRTRLAAGDVLLLYTDGVLEAGLERDMDEFGVERIAACLASGEPSGGVVERLERAVHGYVGAAEMADDLTALCVRCRGGE